MKNIITKLFSENWPLVLGVDIGADNIKYVLIHNTGKKICIESFGRISLDGLIREDNALLTDGLCKIPINASDLKKIKVIIGINDSSLYINKANYPGSIKEKELKQMISFDVEKEMNIETTGGTIITEYVPLVTDNSIEDKPYLVFGMMEEELDNYANPFVSNGMVPTKIVPQIYAYKNLFRLTTLTQQEGAICILDIGTKKSMFVIYKNSKLEYYREILVGGEDFSKAIAGTIFHEGRAIQFTLDEANTFKIKYGYPSGYSEGMTFKGAPLSEVGAMMRPVMERLTGEVHRSIGFFLEKNSGGKISKLYLLGGGGRLKNLSEILSDKVDVSVSLLPVSESLVLPKDKNRSKVFINKYHELTVGLCLSMEKDAKCNLLPLPFRKIHQIAMYHKIFQLLLIILIGGMAISFIFGNQRKSSLQKELFDVKRRVRRIETIGQMYTMLQDSIEIVKGNIVNIQRQVKTDEKIIQVLKMISNTFPEDLSINHYKFGKEIAASNQKTKKRKEASTEIVKEKWLIEMWGESYIQKKDIKMDLANFVLDMEKSGYFESVVITKDRIYPDNLNDKSYTFELKANLIQ